jgi:ABC-type Fe2+-enterobactin transport system substrate-binding protein
MRNGKVLLAAVLASMATGASAQQYPIVDKIAAKVIAHYQNSSCQQLIAEKGQKPTGEKAQLEANAIATMKANPAMAQYFLGKVATPVAEKMFQCGMIP